MSQVKNSNFARSLLGGTMLALAAYAPEASAQETQAATQADDKRTLGTVVITARRREETLKDVPVSVTAISDETLATFGATELGDIQSTAPNGLGMGAEFRETSYLHQRNLTWLENTLPKGSIRSVHLDQNLGWCSEMLNR